MIYALMGAIRIGDVQADTEDTLFVTEAKSLELVIDHTASLVLIETRF